MHKRIAVLASGGGSNLQSILQHFATLGEERPGDVVLVASDRGAAGALERGRAAGVTAVAMDKALRTSGLLSLLQEHAIDLVVLAGYLRFVPAEVTRAFRGRMVNIHPALLPAFGGEGMYGHHVHEAVIARGARVTGATVHFVDEVYDHGPIIAQWPVPVFPHDTAAALAQRVLEVEHALYPRVVQHVASGDISLGDDGRVVGGEGRVAPSRFALSDTPGATVEGIRAILG
ncbi:MAG: phosphoribosylglycinamide formyltransferase [Gemmatimonadetes bacterium SCN 70-22]|nr:MAG: phosphoribosylglycinamide formyltransferase [Gemmatimonadetes bacterium SCN 70-22]